MQPLTRAELWPLERYADERESFRARVIAHKKSRTLALGEHARLLFEDRLTVRYQVQEMLRIERIFEAAGIQAELDAYNPLVPDGRNLKATLMFEYSDPVERASRLAGLVDIEQRVFVEVQGHGRVFALADPGLGREPRDKTSAVHFLGFEFPDEAIAALHVGAGLAVGIDDARMPQHCPLPEAMRQALLADFDTSVARP